MVNNEAQLRLVADLIAAQFGPSTEVVLHDFGGDIDHTIVYIVNGHVTGRRIGDGPTQAFLRYMKHQGTTLDKIRYVTHTADGRMIRSSTVNFFDSDGILNSAMCINQDVYKRQVMMTAALPRYRDLYTSTWPAPLAAAPSKMNIHVFPAMSFQLAASVFPESFLLPTGSSAISPAEALCGFSPEAFRIPAASSAWRLLFLARCV